MANDRTPQEQYNFEYQTMFDLFTRERGLDIEEDNWSQEHELEWAALVTLLNDRWAKRLKKEEK